MPLPLGTWAININGTQHNLILRGVDAKGVLDGGFPPDFILVGLWNEAARMITFVMQRSTFGPNRDLIVETLPELYKGYLISTPTNPQTGEDVAWTLVGYVTAWDPKIVANVGATGRRMEFGWFATIKEVV